MFLASGLFYPGPHAGLLANGLTSHSLTTPGVQFQAGAISPVRSRQFRLSAFDTSDGLQILAELMIHLSLPDQNRGPI